MLTGGVGEFGDLRAWAVAFTGRFVSADPDLPSPQSFNSENDRVREWMDRHPGGVRYCFELDAIHEDLDWLLSELDTDVESRYSNRPDLMRNAVVYHVHNYHYRVHAYREKVAQLLNACLHLGLSDREVNAESVLAAIGSDPGHQAIRGLLSRLIEHEKIKTIVRRRNLIAHRALLLYESGTGRGKRTWRLVTAKQRAQDYFGVEGLSHVTQLFSDLVAFSRHESLGLREIRSFLTGFRYDLAKSLRQFALTSSG